MCPLIKVKVDLGGGHWGWTWESPLRAKPYDYRKPAQCRGYGDKPEFPPRGIAIGLDERHNWSKDYEKLDSALNARKALKVDSKQIPVPLHTRVKMLPPKAD
jgi:hypothetical protein